MQSSERKYLLDCHHVGHRQTGNETWIWNVALGLARLLPGQAHALATPLGAARLEQHLGTGFVHSVSPSGIRRLAFDIPAVIRRLKPDATLVTYTVPPAVSNYVVMIHDMSFEEADAHQWMPPHVRLSRSIRCRMSVRAARRVLVPSQFTADRLMHLWGTPSEKIRITPNAVSEELLHAIATSQRERSRGDELRILAVGNVLPRKNLAVVAKATRLLRNSGIDATLRIVGQTPTGGQEAASALKELSGGYLEWTGYVSVEQLAKEYSNADVLAFPSYYEGFGIPVIEAFAAKLPVVVARGSSLEEVGGPAVLVATPDDPEEWACHLKEAATVKARELAQAGTARFGQFSWESTAKVVAEALSEAN